jgi:hypothetical protein
LKVAINLWVYLDAKLVPALAVQATDFNEINELISSKTRLTFRELILFPRFFLTEFFAFHHSGITGQ